MTPIFATYISNGIKLAEVEKRSEFKLLSKKRNSLTYEYGPDQYFLVYSFGVFVFSNIDQKAGNKITRKFGKALESPVEKEIVEEYEYEIADTEKDSVEFNQARVKTMDLDKLTLITDTLAQSVAIDHFDYLTDDIVAKFDTVNTQLEKRGRLHLRARPLIKMIGTANAILQSSIARMALLDKPELVWEDAALEAFYSSLRKMYELDDRFKIVEVKVQYIRDTSQMAVDLLQDRRANILEVTIVVLLVVEVALFVYELFVK